MRRRAAAAALTAAAATLFTACAAGPTDADIPVRPAIFDRAQTTQDALPSAVDSDMDAASVRFVGEDSGGDRYWVGTKDDAECMLWGAASGDDWLGSCGGLGLSARTADGLTMEFAASPSTLDPSAAELVGDTLLVRRP